MRIRFTWVAILFLLLGYFIVMPDEGTAATKKGDPNRFMWDLKSNKAARVINPNPSPGTPVEDLTNELAAARGGGWSNPGAPLPVTTAFDTLGPDSTGHDTAASRDVYIDGALPSLSAYHFTLDFTLPDSPTRGQSGVIHVSNDPADPTTLDRRYWQADVDIAMPGQPAYQHHFFVEANPDQPGLTLRSVQTAQAPSFSPIASSFFDVFVELEYDGLTPIDPSQPILWITTTAVPEPAAGVVVALSGIWLMLHRRR